MLYLFNQIMLSFHFSSTMFARKSFKFSISAISLSYDICSAFFKISNILPCIVGNLLYAKIKLNK